jgi:hypothetical protein
MLADTSRMMRAMGALCAAAHTPSSEGLRIPGTGHAQTRVMP